MIESKIIDLRKNYEREVKDLCQIVDKLKNEGKSLKEIAETLVILRNDLGTKYKLMTPLDKRTQIYSRNKKKYGNKFGPTLDYYINNNKSWEEIIDSACRPGISF